MEELGDEGVVFGIGLAGDLAAARLSERRTCGGLEVDVKRVGNPWTW